VFTVPGVDPGAETLLRLDRWTKVRRAFDAIATIEQAGIDPVDVVASLLAASAQSQSSPIIRIGPTRSTSIAPWLLRQRPADMTARGRLLAMMTAGVAVLFGATLMQMRPPRVPSGTRPPVCRAVFTA